MHVRLKGNQNCARTLTALSLPNVRYFGVPAGKCSARRPVPWTDEELKKLCDTPTTKKTAEELGRELNAFLDSKFKSCNGHEMCGEGRYCRKGGFCPQPVNYRPGRVVVVILILGLQTNGSQHV